MRLLFAFVMVRSDYSSQAMMKLVRSSCSTRECPAKRMINSMESPPMKMCANDEWVGEQFGQCDLGNKLRTKRLQKVASAMLNCPEQSLPKQNASWADLKGAYRLFQNEHVTFDAIAEKHWKQTRKTKPGRYLLISDTTDIDKWSHPATTGLGMLGDGEGRGM